MKTLRLFLLVQMLFLLVGCNSTITKKEVDRFTSLKKEDFARNVQVKDDAFELRAEVNTKDGFTRKNGLLGVEWQDQFLRAFIDKETGLTVYQVYDIIYMKEWGGYYAANYLSFEGTKSIDVIRISSDVESCSSNQFIGCTLREDIAWNISREDLEAEASGYSDNVFKHWNYKLKGRTGPDLMRTFSLAEIAAFLEAVDNYKSKNNLP